MITELWDKGVRILQQDYPSTVEDLLVADAASNKIEAQESHKIYLATDSSGSTIDMNEYWPDPGRIPNLSIYFILVLD